MTFVGRSVTRLEDRPLVTGRGRFAADVAFPRMVHMRVVRSATRTAGSCRSTRARRWRCRVSWRSGPRPTCRDIPPIDFRLTRIEGLAPYRQPSWPGSACAMSASRSRRVRDRSLSGGGRSRSRAVEIEELPVILDARGARRIRGRPLDRAGDRGKSYGDVARRFAQAHAVVELDLAIGRHSGVPLETRGAIARYDAASDVLELHGAAKVPHWNRDNIARMLGRDPASVHLFEGHVGGGFGIRGELYPEDVLVCVAALRLGGPVKWIEDRREHLIAANHSRQQQP
jgi:CO/xanthine dehydrogenase Mo-binding subunit